MNKIFRIHNKGSNKRLIVAKDHNNAQKIALNFKMAKDAKNLRIEDITAEYLSYHQIIIPNQEGVMAVKSDGQKSTIIITQ